MAAEALVEEKQLKRTQNGSLSTLVPTQRETPSLHQLSQASSSFNDDDSLFANAPSQPPARVSIASPRKHEQTLDEPVDTRPCKKRKLAPEPVTQQSSPPETPRPPTASLYSQQCDGLFIIHHNRKYQPWFNKHNVPYGAQYELARLLKAGRLSPENLDYTFVTSLGGLSNVAAVALVEQRAGTSNGKSLSTRLYKAFDAERDANRPWIEQDLEESCLSATDSPDSCLSGHTDDPTWFGGKITYRAKLCWTKGGFEMQLEKPELGPSNRFARKWGSMRFLRVKIGWDLKKMAHRVVEFFQQPIVLNGRVFRAFDEKDGTVFCFMTNERMSNSRIPQVEVDELGLGRMGVLELIQWHNPLRQNRKQAMAKWASRLALGLSTSVPGPVLNAQDIIPISDIVSKQGSDMTDGAGLANQATLRAIKEQLGLDHIPSAVQVRVDGNKGLIVQKLADSLDDDMQVWLRSSMTKVKRPEPSTDRAQRTIDLLRVAHPRFGAMLSPEVIINLNHNGVPVTALKLLMQVSLVELTAPLIAWSQYQDKTPLDELVDLWIATYKKGSVGGQRAARHKVATSRMRGYQSAKEEDDLDEDEDELALEESTPWWADEFSGQPSTLEETVLYYLSAGFDPRLCWVLAEKLRQMIKASIDNHRKKCRIDVQKAVTAFIVPDETGILKPGEVFFQSSLSILSADGFDCNVIKGPILITRHPCKLPSDIRKWEAVDCFALRDLKDVIVMSTQGERRAADYLSGGDYDGDKALMIWEKTIVEPFVNADLRFADPPEGIEDNFEVKNELVSEFLERAPEGSPQHLKELQGTLLNGITNTGTVGLYSTFHSVACYTLGYDNEETKRLAYMFCMILDGAKTGKQVLRSVFIKDSRRYGGDAKLKWLHRLKEAKKNTNSSTEFKTDYVQRPKGMGTFVIEDLQAFAAEVANSEQERVDGAFKWPGEGGIPHDADLKAPWLDALARTADPAVGHILERDLERIRLHVEEQYVLAEKDAKFTKKPITERQDALRARSLAFITGPKMWGEEGAELSAMWTEEALESVRASYAYVYDCNARLCKGRYSRFPFDVAARTLCRIKAKAVGRETHLAGFVADRMKLMSW
ncbi:hypothetical protein CYLTODRAFT_484791 [Cylindrobasidium torrendii FP15055 ss-10]|uniref:RNA-dependent RNA polymerase n=1 Tax=Cylindrobasidium torrendii FP15055 ss-10 TaxID=1314674 RepID=A0A0D7BV25_9AGAR|nr:hypothetical protein CYLTODRAFT_484791 [Cylindrobasidium torrendii FP15055 ss-10]